MLGVDVPHIRFTCVAFGTRPCNRTDENEGEWDTALIDNCISESLRNLKNKVRSTACENFYNMHLQYKIGRNYSIGRIYIEGRFCKIYKGGFGIK